MIARQIQIKDLGNIDILKDCIIGQFLKFEINFDQITGAIMWLQIHNEPLPPTLECILPPDQRPYEQFHKFFSKQNVVIDSVENKTYKFDSGTFNLMWEIDKEYNVVMKSIIDVELKEINKFNEN